MTIGNISFGVNSKKNFHDFKHDVNSTLGFGFCEPTLIHSMHAKSSVSLQTKSVVRLAPLPCPTFGRIKARQDTIFVPMTDVFEAWNEFISGTGYTTANGSGVPTTVDNMTFNQFFILMNSMNYLGSYSENTFKLENINNLFSQMFTYSVSINWSPFWSGDDFQNNRPDLSWRDLDSLILSASTQDGKGNALRYYQRILENLNGNSSIDFHSKLGTTDSNTFDTKVFSSIVTDDAYIFENWQNVAHSFFKPSYFDNANMPDQQTLSNLSIAFNSAPEVVKSLFDMPRTHQNADFCYVFAPRDCAHFDDLHSFDSGDNDSISNFNQSGGERYKVCLNFHLTPYGKRVMKILNAMGVGSRYDDTIELPKLFAYYKAWFDLYDPQRTKNWKQTTCYKLVHNYYDYRHTMTDYIERVHTYPSGDLFTDLSSFIIDLVKCNYYLGADTFTVAQRYPLQPASGNINDPQMLNGLSKTTYQGRFVATDASSTLVGASGAGQVAQSVSNSLTSLSVVALERLYYAINKESALASNIEEIMLTRFGVNIKSTRVLNRSDYDIEIDPIFGTVNNDKTMLGEYAGKAIASGSTKRIDFDAPEQGYLIQLFSVVPYGGYNQGSTPAQIKRSDFYSDFIAMYDSLGYEKMTKGQILGKESIINNFGQSEEFGSVPQLFHLKYRQNLANGGFAFRSERAGFHPYFLDRIFSEGDINENISGNVSVVANAYSKPIDIVPDTVLRTIGLYEGFGNYDRIFYDTTGLSDNFILHMIQDLKYYSPMKPIRQSFDTFDKNVDDDSRNAEHA